ncbi:amidohydrolase family protein [Saccharopolyspora gregorii]|uniref:amidohydrolase family protein n=1 Tax=Saccharopolyspora gregorii TaxID=33914 RepID=UPI0031E5BB45
MLARVPGWTRPWLRAVLVGGLLVLLLTADLVLTGPDGDRIPDGAVLVDGSTIVAAGSRAELDRHPGAAGAQRRDFPGATILPGLINGHAHLVWDASMAMLAHYFDADDAELLLGVVGRAQRALRAGVTTLRDLGDRRGLVLRVRDAIDRGELTGPRLLGSAAPLTPPKGHCWFFGGEVDGIEAIRAQVRHNAALGADVIKVMASGGQMTPDSPPTWAAQFSRQELRVVVEEATAAGLPVAAHAHGTGSIAAAVAAGVSTIEHCSWQGEQNSGPDLRDEVAREISARGIAVCHAYPPDWRGFAEFVGEQRFAEAVQRVRWMDERGVAFLPGTDSGVPTSVFDDYAGALSYYVEAVGWTPGRVVELATAGAAAALGLDRVGRVSAGFDADLLVVDGDPSADVHALRRQRLVLTRGEPVTPA